MLSHEHDYGPATVRMFLEESAALGDMTPQQVQTDAHMQVSAFLGKLKEYYKKLGKE